MSLADRATIANMAPEYGATMGFFPVDDETLATCAQPAAPRHEVDLVERYCKEQGCSAPTTTPRADVHARRSSSILATVEPSLAGPKRPQDRVAAAPAMKQHVSQATLTARRSREARLRARAEAAAAQRTAHGRRQRPRRPRSTHGARRHRRHHQLHEHQQPVASCSPPACWRRRPSRRACTVQPYVKTSLAPGSRVVTDYFDKAGLTQYLDKLGFHTVGYGCTTCIGNSGPLPEPIAKAVDRRTTWSSPAVLSRQPQLRRPHQPAREGQLPRQPAAGRRLRPGRHDRHRPDQRAARRRHATASRSICRTSGRRTQKCNDDRRRMRAARRCSRSNTATSCERTTEWNAIPVSGGELLRLGRRRAPTSRSRRSSSTCRRAAADPADHAARACWRMSATR